MSSCSSCSSNSPIQQIAEKAKQPLVEQLAEKLANPAKFDPAREAEKVTAVAAAKEPGKGNLIDLYS